MVDFENWPSWIGVAVISGSELTDKVGFIETTADNSVFIYYASNPESAWRKIPGVGTRWCLKSKKSSKAIVSRVNFPIVLNTFKGRPIDIRTGDKSFVGL